MVEISRPQKILPKALKVFKRTTSIIATFNTLKRKSEYQIFRGCPRGVIVKAMDCGIVVREFVLQSRYYVHFRANTLGKGMNPFILSAMG